MSDNYKAARKKVAEKKDFYKHLSTYMTMGLFFFALNMVTNPWNWWFYWPMMGWGIGLASHYFKVFGFPGTEGYSDSWEEKEIEREMRRMETDKRTRNSYHRRAAIPPTVQKEEEYEELELKDLEEDVQKKPQKKWNDSDLV